MTFNKDNKINRGIGKHESLYSIGDLGKMDMFASKATIHRWSQTHKLPVPRLTILRRNQVCDLYSLTEFKIWHAECATLYNYNRTR